MFSAVYKCLMWFWFYASKLLRSTLQIFTAHFGELWEDTAAWGSFTQQILGSDLCTCPSLEQRTRQTRSGLQEASWERRFGEIFYHRCTTIVLRFFHWSLLPSFRLLWVSSTSSSQLSLSPEICPQSGTPSFTNIWMLIHTPSSGGTHSRWQ